jgi:hypothetical protein
VLRAGALRDLGWAFARFRRGEGKEARRRSSVREQGRRIQRL